jgi:hypothetical protein
MRSILFAAVAAILLLAGPARAGYVGLVGNDTGGIIPWSPGIAPLMKAIAADHCARYHKLARITSVHAQYGDYIGFRCLFPRHYDPVKAYTPYWRPWF